MYLIKTKKYKEAIFDILKYPFNKNKIKLMIMLFIPSAISKKLISET